MKVSVKLSNGQEYKVSRIQLRIIRDIATDRDFATDRHAPAIAMGWFDPKSDFRSNPELFSDRRIARNSAGYLPKRNGSASVTLAGRLQRTKAGWRNAVMCRSLIRGCGFDDIGVGSGTTPEHHADRHGMRKF